MALGDLSERERGIVKECLRAAVEGSFFPDWEFGTLFGLDRSEVRLVLDSWPHLDETEVSVKCAVNNSMLNLISYPHGGEQEWPKFISVTREEVREILEKWKGAKGPGSKEREYFDGLM